MIETSRLPVSGVEKQEDDPQPDHDLDQAEDEDDDAAGCLVVAGPNVELAPGHGPVAQATGLGGGRCVSGDAPLFLKGHGGLLPGDGR